MQRVLSELALTGNYQTADLAIAYTYQQSVQLAAWSNEFENDGGGRTSFRCGSTICQTKNEPRGQKYQHVNISRRDVIQAVRDELALYVPRGSRYRRVMRQPIHVKRDAQLRERQIGARLRQ